MTLEGFRETTPLLDDKPDRRRRGVTEQYEGLQLLLPESALADLEQVLGPGHRAGRAEEGERENDIRRQSEPLACASVQDYRVRD